MKTDLVGNAGGETVSLLSPRRTQEWLRLRLRAELSNNSISHNTSLTIPFFEGPNAHPVESLS